jgi:hypothetical protein
MGLYDSIYIEKDGEIVSELQFKSGKCFGKSYKIGDSIGDELPDGVHYCFEGYFVVYNGIIVAAFETNEDDSKLWSKWGDKIPSPDLKKYW